jgi:Aspartyl protease/Tetratricopeptide repeat
MKIISMCGALAAVLAFGTWSARAVEPAPATLFAAGNFDAAASAYAATLAAHPSDAAASLNLGAIRLYQNDVAAAEPLLRAAASADPQNARAASLLREVERRQAEASRRTTVEGGTTMVPFVTSNPLPVVHAIVNGKGGTFLIDTGGTVDLEPEFVAGLGLAMHDAGMGVFAGGKHAPLQATMVDSVALGGATAYDVPAHVMPTHASELFGGMHIDGVIGTSFFERFLVTIDYPRQRLVLRPRSLEISAAFEKASAAAGASIVQCWLVGDHFVFAHARVNAAPPGLFLFDSGLAGGGITSSKDLVEAAKLKLDPSSAQTGVGGAGPATAIPFVAGRVAVGRAVQSDIAGFYMEDAPPFPFQVWGSVSNDFLKHYAFTVDFDAMRIVLAQ